MRIKLLFILLSFCSICNGQQDERMSTMYIIEVLNNNREEAIFYYQNNWGAVSDLAVKRGLMESHQILEAPNREGESHHLILIITFSNEDQYNNREEPYQEMLKEFGPEKLMNDKKPDAFRKVVYKRTKINHLH